MTLNQITKVKGPGIHTLANIVSNSISLGGIATASNFKTGTTNVHNVGVEAAGINVLGADTPIGTGATIYDVGGAVFTGVVTATKFVGQADISGGSIVGTSATFTGNVSIGGTLTYEDVTNIDSVGVITARSGIDCNGTLEVSSTSNFNDTLKIAEKIEHLGDDDTWFGFSGPNAFQLKAGNSTRLYVSDTTAVWNRKDVSAGVGTCTMLLNNNDAAGTGVALAFGPSTNYNTRHSSIEVVQDGNNNMSMRFKVTDASQSEHAIERLRITTAGKVGIGSDIPTSQLDIKRANVSSMPNGNAKPSGASIFNDGGDIFTGRLFWQGTARSASSDFLTGINNEGNVLAMYDYSNTKYMQKWHKNAQVELMHNGNIKLNTRTDGVKITGDTDISMNSNGTGQLYMTGNGYTGGIALDATAMNIYHNSGSRAIIFGTNEDEKLRITSGGSVNIGGDYTQTSKKFKVTGNSTFDGGISFGGVLEGSGFSVASGNVTIPAYIYHDSDAATFFGFPSAGKISFSTGATGSSVEYLRLHRYASVNFVEAGANAHISLADNGTNIRGILIGDGNASSTGGLRLQAGGGSSGFGGGIVMYSHANSDNPGGVYIGKSVGATGSIIFGNSGTGNVSASNEFARITSTGNFGIGMQPTVKLHVDGGTTSDLTAVQIKNDSTSAYATTDGGLNTSLSLYSDGTNAAQGVGIQFYLAKSGETGCISEIGATRHSNGNSTLVFRTRDSSTGVNERMRITPQGCLSIGTATPTQASVPGIHIESDEADDCRIAFVTTNKANTRIGYYGLSNRFGVDMHNGFQIRDAGASYATRLLIDSSGRLSLGGNIDNYNGSNMSSSAANLVVSAAAGAHGGMTIVNTGNNIGNIFFANGTSENAIGRIQYEHQNDALSFTTNNGERLRITNAGHLLLSRSSSPWSTNNSNTVMQLENSSIWDYAGVQFDVGHNYYYDGSDYHFIRSNYACRQTFHNNTGDIAFWSGGTGSADASLTWVDNVRIQANGRMGLGISAPEAVLHPRANPAHGTDTAFQVGTGNRFFKLLELSGQDNFGQCYVSFHDNSLREILTLENTYASQVGMGMEIAFRGLSSGKTGHIQAYNAHVNSGQSELAFGASGGTGLKINHDKITTFLGKIRGNYGVDNSNGNSNKIASGHSQAWGSGNMSGGLAVGWYPIIHLTDGCYMVLVKTGAHSSILFTASNGYDPSNVSRINVLHYTNNRNSSYLNVDGLRITSDGVIEVHLTASSSDYFYMEAQIIGAENIDNSLMFYNTLTKNTGSPTVNDTKYPLSYGTGGMQLENVQVDGALNTSGSKNFRIPHPLSSLTGTKDLVHAAVEGPRADLIYRDNVDLVGGTATVNIDTVTGMTAGTFVALTKNAQCFTTNETGWTNVKGSISGNTLTITAQDNSCTDNISWMVVAQRKDANIISASATDSNGDLILEPPSPLVDTSGQAPDNSMV